MKNMQTPSPTNESVTAGDTVVVMDSGNSAWQGFGLYLAHHAPAVAWIIVAWIVGSLVFELNVTGADLPLHRPMLDQWERIENDSAITHANISAFERIERESKLRPVFNAMIVKATADQAKLSAAQASAAIESKKIALSKKKSSRREIAKPKPAEAAIAKTEPKLSQDVEANSQTIPQLVQLVVHSFQELMGPVNVAQVPAESELSAETRTNTTSESKVAKQRTEKSSDSSTAQAIVPGTNAMTSFVDTASIDVASIDVAEPKQETLPSATIVRVKAKPVIVPEASVEMVSEVVSTVLEIQKSRKPEAEDATVALNAAMVSAELETIETETVENVSAPKIAARWPLLGAANVASTDSVTLNVDKADVRGVLEILARGYQMNILVAPEVTGTVTANVEGLTPEQTLDGIVKMCKLNTQREGDLIYVYQDDSLPADARQLQVFPLDFARAEMLEPVIQGLLSPVGNAYTNKISDRDSRQSRESLVVVDIPAVLSQVELYISQADQAPRQVMIEASILEVVLQDDMMHGVNFDSILSGDFNVGAFGLADPIATRSNPLFFAQVDGSQVTALIDMLETTTDSKTLANPRVQVINGQNAKIQVGQQLGFTVATVTQTATIQDVQFLETGVVLSVTPTISRDNRILMQVKPEVSDGRINPDTLLPEEITREVETSVLLDDHQGVVIGGLIQETDSTIIRKLPWLGDVKYIGKLFQRRESERTRTEIIVALTCHIIEPGCVNELEAAKSDQATQPLFEGLLQRTCRPWEPRMPDQVNSERHLDVNQVNKRIP